MCFFYVNCWFFVVFPRLDSVGQLLSAHETHNQYPLLTQFGSTNDSVGWLPADHHLLVLLQRPQQHQQKQQHVLLQHRCPCCCYTGCCCNTRRCNTRYRANITPVQAAIFWRRLPTLQQLRWFSGYKKGVSSWGVASRETGAMSSKPRRNMPSCV